MIRLEKFCSLLPKLVNALRQTRTLPVRFCTNCVHIQSSSPKILQTLKNIHPKYEIVGDCLLKYANATCIPWAEVIRDLSVEISISDAKNEKKASVVTLILQKCDTLKLFSVGVSYFRYLIDNGEKISLYDLFLFTKILSQNEEEVLRNKELLKMLLKEVKPFLNLNFALEVNVVKLLCRDYDLWKELVDIYDKFERIGSDTAISEIVSAAFIYDEFDIGWKFWERSESVTKEAAAAYFNYCIKLLNNGKFSVSLIDDLVNLCVRKGAGLPHPDLSNSMSTFVSALNRAENKTHVWTLNEKQVDDYNRCLSCHFTLDSVNIKEEEFEKLKNHLLKDVLINENIHIKTTVPELHRFLHFLNCTDYDTVLDGLNILYKRNSVTKVNPITQVINYLKNRDKKLLLIGRTHLEYSPIYKIIKQNCKTFLVSSTSDDDVFLLYATVYKGIDTHFFTSDFLRGYTNLLGDSEVKIIFRKWMISRRYSFHKNSYRIMDPPIHSFLPQRTTLPKAHEERGDLCWHIPVNCTSVKKIFNEPITWYCLMRKSVN